MQDLTFEGRIAMVAGGAGDIGSAIARDLAARGARVGLLDSDAGRLAVVVESIRAAGGWAWSAVVDLSDVSAVRRSFAGFDEALGDDRRLDVLVNAAGLIRYGSLLDTDPATFDSIVGVNLRGAFFCLQEAARRMTEAQSGAILNIASTAAFVAPRANAAVYSMTKAGLRQLTTAAAVELAGRGIRVNAVAPGTIRTQFLQQSLDDPKALDAAVARTPLGRLGLPEDVVGAAVFLCSPLAAYITGQTLVVDGGVLSGTR